MLENYEQTESNPILRIKAKFNSIKNKTMNIEARIRKNIQNTKPREKFTGSYRRKRYTFFWNVVKFSQTFKIGLPFSSLRLTYCFERLITRCFFLINTAAIRKHRQPQIWPSIFFKICQLSDSITRRVLRWTLFRKVHFYTWINALDKA